MPVPAFSKHCGMICADAGRTCLNQHGPGCLAGNIGSSYKYLTPHFCFLPTHTDHSAGCVSSTSSGLSALVCVYRRCYLVLIISHLLMSYHHLIPPTGGDHWQGAPISEVWNAPLNDESTISLMFRLVLAPLFSWISVYCYRLLRSQSLEF